MEDCIQSCQPTHPSAHPPIRLLAFYVCPKTSATTTKFFPLCAFHSLKTFENSRLIQKLYDDSPFLSPGRAFDDLRSPRAERWYYHTQFLRFSEGKVFKVDASVCFPEEWMLSVFSATQIFDTVLMSFSRDFFSLFDTFVAPPDSLSAKLMRGSPAGGPVPVSLPNRAKSLESKLNYPNLSGSGGIRRRCRFEEQKTEEDEENEKQQINM